MATVFASGGFDNLRSRHVRFLEEASRLAGDSGELHVLLWSDEVIRTLTGRGPKFPQEERHYMVQAIRYVNRVTLVTDLDSPDALPVTALTAQASDSQTDKGVIWALDETDDGPAKRAYCAARGIDFRVFTSAELQRFPGDGGQGLGVGGQGSAVGGQPSAVVHRPSVIVTGCYDWLHSGHVRFFEEASTYGDLYVVAGNDANVRHLKGEGHPMQTQEERRYMVGAIRYVKQALITSGMGWMDAEPEIARLKPDIYLVNEDGDKPEKQAFCAAHGLRYVVLKRTPKEGLPRRSSTDLRGF
jgi:cytidyltransferase-like protein